MNLVPKFRLDIADIIRRARKTRRSRIVLRPISAAGWRATELSNRVIAILDAWSDPRIMAEYSRSLSQITGDSPIDIEAAITSIGQSVAAQIQGDFSRWFADWFSSLAVWHRQRMLANLRYATDIDLSDMIADAGLQITFEELLARNVALVRSISDSARASISDAVYRGLQARTPVRDVAREISDAIGLGRARARRIASDQLVKATAALDRKRMEDIGIDSFKWLHSGKVHYRPHHKARDGKVFRFDDPDLKGDLPGMQPFCGCKQQGVIDLG